MSSFSLKDYFYMQQALLLAENARVHAPPNPWVGCIIVNNNEIVGKGFTQPPGQAHAEIKALEEAKSKAREATLYVTLEPCCHTGRTSPCVQAIIASGIRQVFIAQKDPDIRVSGQGIHQLKEAGIEVKVGLCQAQAKNALLPYLHQRSTGLPYTVVKVATSLDGRLAAADGSSQWISSSEARKAVHLQRAHSGAILIGAQTALKDKPRLTVRYSSILPPNPPLRIILDAKGKVPPTGPLFDQQLAPTLVVTTDQASIEQKKAWEKARIEIMQVSSSFHGVDLLETWQLLGKRSILQLFVESGGMLFSELVKLNLCQQLSIYIGNCLLGIKGAALFQDEVATLSEANRLELQSVQQWGQSVQLDYLFIPPKVIDFSNTDSLDEKC